MRTHPITTALLIIALAASLSGCAGTKSSPAATTTSPSPASSPTSSPKADSVPLDASKRPTCSGIVTPAALTEMTTPPFYAVTDVMSRIDDVYPPLHRFIDLGGVVCQWGEGPDKPNDNVVTLAFAIVTPGQADAERAKLAADGWQKTTVDVKETWVDTGKVSPANGFWKSVWVFSGNTFRYASQPGGLESFSV